ncbi:MAG TPA: UvrD-helicase domain-containing protein [Cyclobacteriaceae bacterium]|nr:UvrD-helicase domain-containing protein [Cyclobacteriaceae bacterium]
MEKLFQIYRSSAGSGKTRTLAKEYLKLAFRFRSDYFKHILAVTFTNKSTQEMKDRIMRYLDEFAQGKPNELAKELQAELGLDAATFQSHSREVQAEILHNYHEFSISTIDAFFQRVIRSFTREAGILGDYRLEVENDEVMEQVISNLIGELGESEQLTKWIVELALQNLENDRSWDMRQSLASFSNEIFREEFKSIEGNLTLAVRTKNFFPNALKALQEKKYSFLNFVRAKTQRLLEDVQSKGLRAEDFKYSGGIYNFLEKFVRLNSVKDFTDKDKGSRVDNEFQNGKNWPSKDHARGKEIVQLADQKWIPMLNEILDFRKKNFEIALSAEIALNNFYAFGLLTDISRKLGEYKKENNLMLLADAPQFLNSIIDNSDTPFIYEKAGSFYKNFLIDEFQDTSGLQWKNFQPLLTNSLDSGHRSLIVGDVKQAVYRWRGGDQNLLPNADQTIGLERTDTKLLDKNFRSVREIVSFNNELFKTASAIVASETGLAISLKEYIDVAQTVTRTEDGYAMVKFVEEDGLVKWTDRAMEQMVQHVEELQRNGVRPQDIALLVRRNDEGEKIISYLLDHKNSTKAHATCVYDVVSSESLRIDSASSVNLIVAALTYLLNPMDDIARAQLIYEYARHQNLTKPLSDVFASSNPAIFENSLPTEFIQKKSLLRKLALFEMTESLIDIFQLKEISGELPYLLAFQDLVLEFAHRERNDLGAFLVWWLEYKFKKSIVAPASADAMQLFTVHKAKGLQFKYVIVPFCSWSLDHEPMRAPNLWVKSDESIFKNIGYVPVKYSGTLRESLFAEDYHVEHSRIFLDNFNLLYVALTRAEKGLFVVAPDPSVPRIFKTSIARLLYEGIERSAALSSTWNKAAQSWSSGQIAQVEMAQTLTQTTSLQSYNTGSWRSKLVVKHSAHSFDDSEKDQRKKINFGIHLHAAFARVTTGNDIPKAIDQLESDGAIHQSEKEELIRQMNRLMANPQVANWFSEEWEVRNEAHSILPKGKEYRIDRLLLKGKEAVIIDFKTGKAKKEDQKQIGEYCHILNQMGFSSEGYLLYLTEGEVVNVVPPKAPKMKNKSQLGLDF